MMNLFPIFPFILKWDKGIVPPLRFLFFTFFYLLENFSSLVCHHFPPEEYKINICLCTLRKRNVDQETTQCRCVSKSETIF